jgi:general stress protein CsbA
MIGPLWDMWVAFPYFLIVCLVIFTRMSRFAAVLTAILLAAFTGRVYYAYAHSESSTAALVFLAPWFWGIPGILATYGLDALVRQWRGRHAG